MQSRWCYILIGDNNTGKTTFQRDLAHILSGKQYKSLPSNKCLPVRHPQAPPKLRDIFFAGRSYQELSRRYRSVSGFFDNHFAEADIAVLSSHSHSSCIHDVRTMIDELHARYYNVSGVFWSNADSPDAQRISALPWQERFRIENPVRRSNVRIKRQIRASATDFADLLLARAALQ